MEELLAERKTEFFCCLILFIFCCFCSNLAANAQGKKKDYVALNVVTSDETKVKTPEEESPKVILTHLS